MDVRIKDIKNIEEKINSIEEDAYYCRIETPINATNLMEYIDLSIRDKRIMPEDGVDLKSKFRKALGGFMGNCTCRSLFH